MKIVFVGLSNKKDMIPFDIRTNSGKIVNEIISKIDAECYKLNLVSFAPLDSTDKLRYPTKIEIKKEIPIFLNNIKNINPDLIIGFGNIVCNELNKIDEIKTKLIIEKHPSYMYIYKKKELEDYIENIIIQINNFKEK